MNEELKKKHRIWVRKQVESLGCCEMFEESRDGVPLCANCGCAGNVECGHKPLNDIWGCTLIDESCCCCSIETKRATDEEVDKKRGQGRLI